MSNKAVSTTILALALAFTPTARGMLAYSSISDYVREYQIAVGGEKEGLFFANCRAQLEGFDHPFYFYLILPRTKVQHGYEENARIYQAAMDDDVQIIVNIGYLDITNGKVDVISAAQGGLYTQENMRIVAQPLLKKDLKLTFSVADVFKRRPENPCELAPPLDFNKP